MKAYEQIDLGKPVYNQLSNQLWNQLHDQLRNQLYILGIRIHNRLWNQLHIQPRNGLGIQLLNQLNNQKDLSRQSV